MSTDLELCLPAELRGPETTIVKLPSGLSGAGVYRVEAGSEAYVLKVSNGRESFVDWRRKAHIQQSAADAGLAPRIVHVDEARRAVVTVFVVDRSFPALFFDPRTRDAALALLARTMGRTHALPLPSDAAGSEPRQFLSETWSAVEKTDVPPFVVDAVRRVLAEPTPASGRAPVLSHNDANPSNLVYDGEHLFLVDWDAAGPNDPLYDLAVLAVFLRMDDETCRRLIAGHDDAAPAPLPPAFVYCRRLAAALLGAMFLRLAQQGGRAGSSDADTLETTPSLIALYQQMRSGALSLATADGQWIYGLTMAKISLSL